MIFLKYILGLPLNYSMFGASIPDDVVFGGNVYYFKQYLFNAKMIQGNGFYIIASCYLYTITVLVVSFGYDNVLI